VSRLTSQAVYAQPESALKKQKKEGAGKSFLATCLGALCCCCICEEACDVGADCCECLQDCC
jgi:hypothetical protein